MSNSEAYEHWPSSSRLCDKLGVRTCWNIRGNEWRWKCFLIQVNQYLIKEYVNNHPTRIWWIIHCQHWKLVARVTFWSYGFHTSLVCEAFYIKYQYICLVLSHTHLLFAFKDSVLLSILRKHHRVEIIWQNSSDVSSKNHSRNDTLQENVPKWSVCSCKLE